MNELQTTPKFPLLELPYLSLKDTVKQMALMDILKFSKSSRIGDNLVQFMKLKTDSIDIFADLARSHVSFQTGQIEEQKICFYSEEEFKALDESYNDPSEKHLVLDHIEECFEMTSRMKKLFEVKGCTCHITHLSKNPDEMIHILSRIPLEKCTFLRITERLFIHRVASIVKVLDGKVLDYLTEHLNPDAQLHLNCLFPEDYNYQKLFKFRSFNQNNASWLTMEHLKSLRYVRNAGSFYFNYTNFNTEDIVEFLEYFVNCEEDMMEYISIHVKDENDLSEDKVLNQILCYFDLHTGCHLIKVHHTKNRKQIMAKINFRASGRMICLETITDIEQYGVQLEILELMEREQELEGELRVIEEDPSNDQMERETEIQVELVEIRRKLSLLRD
ncbi:unnamed protein product [Caenorhabditis brenneri]